MEEETAKITTDENEWIQFLIENLPETEAPKVERPGAEYRVEA